MEKFDFNKHGAYAEHLPFSYFSLPCYLDFCAYTFERNGEHLLVTQDLLYPNDFPSLFLPRSPKNWERTSMLFASSDDIELIKKESIEILVSKYIEKEYFYATETLADATGSTKSRIRQFERLYEYCVYDSYPSEKVATFYQSWKSQRERTSITAQEGEEFFSFCLQRLEQYKIKQIYVEIEGRLVGIAWGVDHPRGDWVGLHLIADYQYKGLSRFLHQERARLFAGTSLVTLGTGAQDSHIAQYKEELGPAYTKEYFYVLTGDKNI